MSKILGAPTGLTVVIVRCPLLEGRVTLYKMTVPMAVACREQEQFPADFGQMYWEEMCQECSTWPYSLNANSGLFYAPFYSEHKRIRVFLSAI